MTAERDIPTLVDSSPATAPAEVSAPPAAAAVKPRHLPFAYAKRHGVLVNEMHADHVKLFFRKGVPAHKAKAMYGGGKC